MTELIDKQTGKLFFLAATKEYIRDLREFEKTKCRHESTSLRTSILENGTKQIREQCLCCGHMLGNALKQSGFEVFPPLEDPDLRRHYDEKRRLEKDCIDQKHVNLQKLSLHEKEKEKTNMDRFRRKYMESEKWRKIREKIFKRANGLCEACLENPATQVHHWNYDNLGNEYMFDLSAVCKPCHCRIHGIDINSAEIDLQF